MAFPSDFVWGTATASYQIEGAAFEDGRGETIWDRFSHLQGKVMNGDTGDVACDHYHRFRDDIGLMKELGIKGYRFSTAWSRVLPLGHGQLNEKGLDFYDNLVDALLEAGITPYITLYHWDLPQALQDRGGWANPDSVKWFADYASLMAQTLGDRVKHWITLNEPFVVAFVGNWFGVHAPGITDVKTAFSVAHHLNLGHGAAVPLIRQHSAHSQVGVTLNFTPSYPASDKPEDIAATKREDGYVNRWFIDPMYKGHYPQDMLEWLGDWMGHIDVDAVKAAAAPLDFLGVNFYTRALIAHDELVQPFHTQHKVAKGAEHTAMEWEVYPDALRDLLVRLHQEYDPKAIYITENGSAFDDPAPVNGIVEDPQRVAYLERHLAAVEQAMAQGAPVKGYFAWSLMDNFEWAYGYERRFGVYYVDFQTQARYPKRTALRYKDIIATSKL